MEFIESHLFARQIDALLDDDSLGDLQHALAHQPTLGDVIPGGHGLRKLRWRSDRTGRGKRGGIRVIYYLWSRERVYLVFAYDKAAQADLTRDQLKRLAAYVQEGVVR